MITLTLSWESSLRLPALPPSACFLPSFWNVLLKSCMIGSFSPSGLPRCHPLTSALRPLQPFCLISLLFCGCSIRLPSPEVTLLVYLLATICFFHVEPSSWEEGPRLLSCTIFPWGQVSTRHIEGIQISEWRNRKFSLLKSSYQHGAEWLPSNERLTYFLL